MIRQTFWHLGWQDRDLYRW